MSNALTLAHQSAMQFLDGLDQRPIASRSTLKTLRNAFDAPLPQTGTSAEQVIELLGQSAEPGMLGSASGRFFAWVIGGSVESALAADWLVSTWDQNAALYACSPAAAIIEEVAGNWIKSLLRLPEEASFAFTTGCQLAHMTGLAAARYAVLSKHGWDVENDGLFNAPQIKVLVSKNKHGSVERALRYLGLGRRSMEFIETNAIGQMQPAALAAALSEVNGPAILCLNAADLNVGAFDPFAKLIPLAKQKDVWVHIDGAFGLFARASKKLSHLTEGVELADSWSTDGHKWLNVPFDCGISIVRDSKAHRAAMTLSADYIEPNQVARDQIDWNPEWSRRARGIPVYAALMELGAKGVEDMINRCCDHCSALVSGIGELPGAKVVAEPTLNQGLLRFEREGMTPSEGDAYTVDVIEKINASGEAFFSGGAWDNRKVMRVSVVNWRTTETDVARAVNAARIVLTE